WLEAWPEKRDTRSSRRRCAIRGAWTARYPSFFAGELQRGSLRRRASEQRGPGGCRQGRVGYAGDRQGWECGQSRVEYDEQSRSVRNGADVRSTRDVRVVRY